MKTKDLIEKYNLKIDNPNEYVTESATAVGALVQSIGLEEDLLHDFLEEFKGMAGLFVQWLDVCDVLLEGRDGEFNDLGVQDGEG